MLYMFIYVSYLDIIRKVNIIEICAEIIVKMINEMNRKPNI